MHGSQKPGFLPEKTRYSPQNRPKTRFLGFSGSQKPGFLRGYFVTARRIGKKTRFLGF
jgi:hypothetical protein